MTLPYENTTSDKKAIDDMQKTVVVLAARSSARCSITMQASY